MPESAVRESSYATVIENAEAESILTWVLEMCYFAVPDVMTDTHYGFECLVANSRLPDHLLSLLTSPGRVALCEQT